MATVPVARISSCTAFRSATPNFTPMDCNRSAESWTGARGVSVGGGVELEELFWPGSDATLGAETPEGCGAPDRLAVHQIPASTQMKTKFPISARTNGFR